MLKLGEDSLNWALEHALNYGDTDVFPHPFEYKAIEHNWAELSKYLLEQNVLEWQVRPHRSLLAPKARYGFRGITQLDPLDFLVFSALMREISADLERSRVPQEQERVFSFRCNPKSNGQLFDPEIGFIQFQQRTDELLSGDNRYVVLTDIADFYSRIYFHRLENALQVATDKGNHVRSIGRLISGWNGTETFGIPVGSAPARLLAEITISDVDQALLASGIEFIRFNDDYRIFSKNHAGAYKALTLLADYLYRNHGLTLNQRKTRVLEASVLQDSLVMTHEQLEFISKQERFNELLANLGLVHPYDDIDYEELDEEQKSLVDSLNLVEMLRHELTQQVDIDYSVAKFAIRRLAQLGDSTVLYDILENLDALHPLFPDIIRYLKSLRSLSQAERVDVGARIIDLLKDSILSELHYHRMWALELFAQSTDWDNEGRFLELLASASDQVSRRKLILAMGKASQRYWFQSQWRFLFEEPAWSRRALIVGASCMPVDARRHWYRSIESRLDPLEIAVMKWARTNPFSQ